MSLWLKARHVTTPDHQSRWLIVREYDGKEEPPMVSLSDAGMQAFLDSVQEQHQRAQQQRSIQETVQLCLTPKPPSH